MTWRRDARKSQLDMSIQLRGLADRALSDTTVGELKGFMPRPPLVLAPGATPEV